MPAGNTAPPQLQRVHSPSPSVLTGGLSTLPFGALSQGCRLQQSFSARFAHAGCEELTHTPCVASSWLPTIIPAFAAPALGKHLSITKTVRLALCHCDLRTHSYKSSIHWSAQPLAKRRAWQCLLTWELVVMQTSCNNFSTARPKGRKRKALCDAAALSQG